MSWTGKIHIYTHGPTVMCYAYRSILHKKDNTFLKPDIHKFVQNCLLVVDILNKKKYSSISTKSKILSSKWLYT